MSANRYGLDEDKERGRLIDIWLMSVYQSDDALRGRVTSAFPQSAGDRIIANPQGFLEVLFRAGVIERALAPETWQLVKPHEHTLEVVYSSATGRLRAQCLGCGRGFIIETPVAYAGPVPEDF